jgi:DNA-binding CsgD family transcriptional regulator
VNQTAVEQGKRGGVDLEVLSDREREVLALALTGLSAKAIADQLTLTQATIRSHLSRIYAKLGVGGRVELLAKTRSQPFDREGPLPSVPIEPGRPRRHRLWPVIAALAISVVVVGAGALFLWLRPDLPPSTDLATVSQLVTRGQATSLDLRDDTLIVTSNDGRQYRVDGVDGASFNEMLPKALGSNVHVTISKGNGLTPASILGPVSALATLIVLLVVGLMVFRRLRRSPRFSPAATS